MGAWIFAGYVAALAGSTPADAEVPPAPAPASAPAIPPAPHVVHAGDLRDPFAEGMTHTATSGSVSSDLKNPFTVARGGVPPRVPGDLRDPFAPAASSPASVACPHHGVPVQRPRGLRGHTAPCVAPLGDIVDPFAPAP